MPTQLDDTPRVDAERDPHHPDRLPGHYDGAAPPGPRIGGDPAGPGRICADHVRRQGLFGVIFWRAAICSTRADTWGYPGLLPQADASCSSTGRRLTAKTLCVIGPTHGWAGLPSSEQPVDRPGTVGSSAQTVGRGGHDHTRHTL